MLHVLHTFIISDDALIYERFDTKHEKRVYLPLQALMVSPNRQVSEDTLTQGYTKYYLFSK